MKPSISHTLLRSAWLHALLTFCLCVTLLNGCGQPDQLGGQPLSDQADEFALTPTLTEPDQAATVSALRRTAIAEEEAAVATALAQPIPTDGPPPPWRTPELIVVQTGMNVCIDAYIGLLETNCWLDLVNGVYVQVVAGAREDDEAQGVLVVNSFSLRGEPLMDVTWYDTPSRLGAVGIHAVNNPHLQIVTEHDISFVFNVATLSWERSPAFQTATPTPTMTGPEQGATTHALEQTGAAELQRAMATARALPTPTDGPPPPWRTPELIIVKRGFDVCREAHIQLKDTNCWLDIVNGVYIHVVAGAREDDEAQGVIVVSSFSLRGEPLMDTTWYNTPSRVGAVGIDAVNSPYLHLVTKDQTPFVFNVSTLTWENPTTFQTATPTADPPPITSATPFEPTALPYGTPMPPAMIQLSPTPTQSAARILQPWSVARPDGI